jgi:flotillin
MSNLALFAATSSLGDEGSVFLGLSVVVFLLAALGILVFGAKRYKRCPSNRVLVIFGKVASGRCATCIHGGGRFVLPIVQDYAYLSLEPIQIEVPLRDALSIENIRVNVPSVFTVAIGIEPAIMQNAAIRLLGLDTPHVKKQAEDIIFGQLRQVIASMHIDDINRDREKFLHNIQNSVEPELQKIGLVLINVNITDITDGSGYIEAIGRNAASEAIQKARGDVAEQEKLGETRVAEADRDKTVQVAEAHKVREIGTRTASREQAVRVADLNKEQQVGEKRAGFAQDMEVAEADREKRIAVANANALAFSGETESQAKVADAEARLKVKKAEAYQLGETRQ